MQQTRCEYPKRQRPVQPPRDEPVVRLAQLRVEPVPGSALVAASVNIDPHVTSDITSSQPIGRRQQPHPSRQRRVSTGHALLERLEHRRRAHERPGVETVIPIQAFADRSNPAP